MRGTESLTALANRHGSDKGTVGPSPRWPAHNYTDVYEAYLERLRPAPIALLEIGLGVTGEQWEARIVQGSNTGGASLKMWHDYFPNARIYGIDVNECSYLDDERLTTFVADQGDVAQLRAFTEATGGISFDVIVDDGSHRPDHQQVSLDYFFKLLKPNGLYFIEDLLANGRGDGRKGRMACDHVVNTRSLLRELRDHGSPAEPHALADPGYLRDQVDHIGLHAPAPRLRRRQGGGPRRARRAVPGYREGSESLAALRKRP